jgi:hypothetical protein
MNKITKYALLFLLVWPYLVVSTFDIAFGTLALAINAIRVPFSVAGEWLIDKANDINIK